MSLALSSSRSAYRGDVFVPLPVFKELLGVKCVSRMFGPVPKDSTTGKLCRTAAGCHALFPTGSIHTLLVRLPYEEIVRTGRMVSRGPRPVQAGIRRLPSREAKSPIHGFGLPTAGKTKGDVLT